MEKLLLTLCLAPALLAGCAIVPIKPPGSGAPQIQIPQLTARTLDNGDCGLFVWSADAQRRFTLYAGPGGAGSVWHDGDTERSLNRISTSGEPAQGQFPHQSFTAGTAELHLDLRAPQSIEGGMRYKAGVLKISGRDDWEKTVPVVGLATCR